MLVDLFMGMLDVPEMKKNYTFWLNISTKFMNFGLEFGFID